MLAKFQETNHQGSARIVNMGQFQPYSDMGITFTNAWMSLMDAGMWGGVVAGALMIFAAIKLRRWRDEA